MDRDLRIRLLFQALDKVSRPLRDVAGGASKAGKAIAATREKLKALEAAQADTKSFRALGGELRETGNAMRAAQERAAALKRTIDASDNPTKKLIADYAKARAEISTLATREREQATRLDEIRERMRAAGVATGEIAAHERKLREELAATNTELKEQEERYRTLSARSKQFAAGRKGFEGAQAKASASMAAGTGTILSGVAAAAPVVSIAKEAMTFESVMADVKKVANFSAPAAQLQQVSDGILQLSQRLPVAAEGIAQIVSFGARSGIANVKGKDGQLYTDPKQLLAFAADAAKMSVAFDTTAEDAGAMMSRWREAFGMGQGDVRRLGDQVNALTNAYGGNVLGVAQMVTRVGPLGRVANVSASSIAAMAQVLDKVGVEAEVGATGIKNVVLALAKGEAATKMQKAAFEALGLTSTAVSRNMQKDANATVLDVFNRIARLPKATQAGVLTRMFGKESVEAIAPLLTNLDLLKRNLQGVGKASFYAGSMQKEYDSRAGTTANAVQLAENNIAAFKITVGTQLLPVITALAGRLGNATRAVTSFAKEHPTAARNIALLAGAISALMVLAGSMMVLRGALMMTFAPLSAVLRLFGVSWPRAIMMLVRVLVQPLRLIGVVAGAFRFLGLAVMRAGMMMLANPVVLAITAIVAALAIAGYLIWKHWDTIKAAFSAAIAALAGYWTRLKAQFGGGLGAIAALLVNFSPLGLIYRGIAGMLSWLGIHMPASLADIGRNMMLGLIHGITGMLGQVKSTIVNAASAVTNWFKAKLGIHSPSRVFMGLGGFVMEGLDRGIAGGERAPVRRIGALTRRMADALSPELAPRIPEPTGTEGGAPPAPAAIPRASAPLASVRALIERSPAPQVLPVPLPAPAAPIVPPLPRPAPATPGALAPIGRLVQQVSLAPSVTTPITREQPATARDAAPLAPIARLIERVPAPRPIARSSGVDLEAIGRRVMAAIAIGTATPAVAAEPSAAAAASKPPVVINNHYALTINGTPGMNEQQLADLVVRKLRDADRQKAARGRSSFADDPDWSHA